MFRLKLLLVLLLTSPVVNSAVISLENSTLNEFAHFVGQTIKRPVLIASDLNRPFSINAEFVDDVQLVSLLRDAVTSSGLSFEDDGKSIVISELRYFDLPHIQTEVFALKHQSTSFVIAQLKQHLGAIGSLSSAPSGHVSEADASGVSSGSGSRSIVFSDNPSTNSVLVTANQTQLRHVAKLIDSLDVPSKQVLIEAVISELSKTAFEGLDTKLALSNDLDAVADQLSAFNPAAGFSLRFINHNSLQYFLDYINTSDDSRVLSRPKLLVIDRQKASLIVGQNVPFITGQVTNQASQTTTPFQTIERHDVGLKLDLAPTITADGKVSLDIYQENSSVANNTSASDIVTNLRSIRTSVLLANGSSLLIGGLASESFDTGESWSIPLLSDIPYLGILFRSSTDREERVNLVIMLTASIVVDPGRPAQKVQPDRVGRPGSHP